MKLEFHQLDRRLEHLRVRRPDRQRRQRGRQLRLTFARPAERRHRIAPGQRLHQAFQGGRQPRLGLLQRRAPAPGRCPESPLMARG